MSSTQEVKLITSKDWDAWIAIVKGKATGYLIWDLVNPALTTKPTVLIEPIEPAFPAISADAAANSASLTAYKLNMTRYKSQVSMWEKQHASFTKLIDFIYSTVGKANLIYLQNTEVHPWDFLRALKAKLAPSDSARSLAVEKEYHRLKAGPGSRRDVEAWVDDWSQTLVQAKDNNLAEALDNRRVYRDFLLAIEKHAPVLAQFCVYGEDNITDYQAALAIAEEKFRQHIRLHDVGKGGVSHSAFATDENEKSNQNHKESKKPSYKGKVTEPGECLCGVKQWYGDCDYLRTDRPGRPQNFRPDPVIKRKVEEKLKDPKTKEKANKALERSRKFEAKDKDNKSSPSPSPTAELGTFSVVGASYSNTYHLQSSWIVDHGSSYHVCNKTMKDRFVKEFDSKDDTLIAVLGNTNVVAYGGITLNVKTPTGKGVITITNVAYIPDFMVNVVSGSMLEDKGIHFVPEHRLLHHNGQTMMLVTRNGGHYVLEDNTENSITKSSGTFAGTKPVNKSGTTREWHQLLAHAGNDSIQHLAGAAEGVEITDKEKVPNMNDCEICVLSKAHRIVSRSSYKAETSSEPFFRITYDLMQMSTALNKEQWVSHVACSEKDFQMVYTHKNKSEATEILRKAIKTIQTRFNYKVAFIRSDGETSLGKEFYDLITELGISFEPSAPDTAAQNGHSERKGGILAIKARAMRLQANLPQSLWPWVIQTAGFLMNRTPMKKHSWKTPFEEIVKHKPNLNHLKQYGCKANPLDKSIPRKEKLAPRTHIGFLVGYEGTNIFNI